MIMEISIVQCIRTYFVYSLFFLVDFEILGIVHLVNLYIKRKKLISI